MSDETGTATTDQHASRPTGGGRPRRLVRLRDDRVICGVAAGLGAYTRTDPVLWRIGFVVLTFFSGIGLIAYVVLWIAVPSEDGTGAASDVQQVADVGGNRRWLGIAALVAGAAILVHEAWDLRGGLVLGILLIGAGAALWTREAPLVGPDRGEDDEPSPKTEQGELTERAELSERREPTERDGLSEQEETSERTQGAEEGGVRERADLGGRDGGPPPPQDGDDVPTTPLPPRRQGRSVLGRLVLGSAALVAGAGLLLDEVGVLDAGVGDMLAAVLVVVGAGLLVGTWWGRARWLIFPGVALALIVMAVAYAPHTVAGFSDGAGDQQLRPRTLADLESEYRLGAGELVLDLSGLDLDGRTRSVDAHVGVGELDVIVPDDVAVVASGRTGAGEVDLLGESQGGLGVSTEIRRGGENGAGRLVLDLNVGLGEITVTRDGTVGALSILEDLDEGDD